MAAKTYYVISGTRQQPGEVIATFETSRFETPATACIAYHAKHSKRSPMFFSTIVPGGAR